MEPGPKRVDGGGHMFLWQRCVELIVAIGRGGKKICFHHQLVRLVFRDNAIDPCPVMRSCLTHIRIAGITRDSSPREYLHIISQFCSLYEQTILFQMIDHTEELAALGSVFLELVLSLPLIFSYLL